MDAAHQRYEGLSVIEIHFADSVAEGEVIVPTRTRRKTVAGKVIKDQV